MNNYIVFVFTFLICKNLNAQNIISGYIYDIDSKESLIGANVVVNEKKNGTVTNYNGFFKLNLPSGIFNLTISYVGYKPVNKRIEVRESKSIDFFLETEILDEIFLISDFARSRESNAKSNKKAGTWRQLKRTGFALLGSKLTILGYFHYFV